MSKEEIVLKLSALQSATALLKFQINSLKQFVAPIQVTAWRKRRATLNKSIKFYKQLIRKYNEDKQSK